LRYIYKVGELFAVVVVHGELDAAQREGFDGFAGLGGALLEQRCLVVAELAEHEVCLMAARELVADAEAQAGVLVGAEALGDALQTVVAALASGGLHAQGAQGQGDVVADHQQPLEVYLLLLDPVAHGVAAEVHVGRGFEENEFVASQPHLSHGSVALVLKHGSGFCRQRVDHAESYVVAGTDVFVAYVAESCDEIVHFLGCLGLSLAGAQPVGDGFEDAHDVTVRDEMKIRETGVCLPFPLLRI
jgi:hypothetical protein